MSLSRRAFVRIIGGTAVFAAVGVSLTRCDRMPAEAVAAWDGPPAGETEPRRRALSYALLAPNPHNTQAWIADLREAGVVTLSIDKARLLPATDPWFRQIVIGCGAFLEVLRIAAAEAGYRTEVTLFPAGAWAEKEIGETPLARIAFVPDAAVGRDKLFAQVLKRRSVKVDYEAERPIEAAHRAALAEVTQLPLQVATAADEVATLRGIAKDAWLAEVATPRANKESADYFRIGADEIATHRDGLSFHGPFFWWAKRFGLFTAEKALEPGSFAYQGAIDTGVAWAEQVWSFGWLATPGGTRADEIAAGRDYVRLNLKATELGVAMAPLSQVLQEYPEMAGPQKRFLDFAKTPPGSIVQMFFRLGYAGQVPPTPRRVLDDLIRA